MEPKNHFSHNHGLVLHHLSEAHCSGCKSPASGYVYACRQCNFFLHQQCFHAPKSLNHPSHPLHPLTLMPSPTYPSSCFNCDSCNLVGHGFSYTCSQCEFDIHIHCAHTPTTIKHSSHPHDLTLQTTPPPPVTCNACLKSGKELAYTCGECSFNLHVDCMQRPEIVTRSDHEHSLKLFYSSPSAGTGGGEATVFVCSVCVRAADRNAWVYYCEKCDFGTHLNCVAAEVKREFSSAEAAEIEEELSRLVAQKVRFDDVLKLMRPKTGEEKEEEEASARKMEMEEELRRRRHNLTMQRLQQASDSIDFMGRIGSTPQPKLFDRYKYNF